MVSVLEVAPIQLQEKQTQGMRWWALVLAAIASAALFWFGTGLTPVAALTWLAPLPVFAVAIRTSGRAAAAVAAAAWLAGSLNMWTYFQGDLHMPPAVVAGVLILQAAIFAATVLLYRALLRRGRAAFAAFAAGAAWAAGEYLFSLVSPGGAFSSLAYTQTEVLPVVQLASATGVWGIAFLLIAVPASLAAITRAAWPRLVTLLCVLIAATVGFGLWQLRAADSAQPVTIGLLDVRQTEDSLPIGSPEAQKVLDAYLQELPSLASSGATIAVLPEKLFKVSATELSDLEQRLNRAATGNHMTIVIGLTLKDTEGVHNVAMAYTGDGFVRYDKQHLVPGWEDHITPGNALAFLPDTHTGLVICKDMDYPTLTRSYGRQGGNLLLVPALDVDRDGWLHSRIAVMRGVESGATVVRAAGRGLLTVSDAQGRIIADAATTAGTTGTLAVVHPVSTTTLYVRLGDWFAWLCLALLALVPFVARRAKP